MPFGFLSEKAFRFAEVPSFVGPAYGRFSRNAVDWNLAAETIAIFNAPPPNGAWVASTS
jgi:hypothetical protein